MFGFLRKKKQESRPVQPVPPAPECFEYDGYRIPLDLVHSTGGGPETFDAIIQEHTKILQAEIGVHPDSQLLEVGCGIGRDAMPLAKLLSAKGSYLGIDIIERSIRFCSENITPRHPNFRFVHFDVCEQWYNPNGKLKLRDLKLPVGDANTDIVILHSVFTHMLEEDVVHYLKEFSRILKPTGRVLATFFIVDDAIRESARVTKYLTFEHKLGDHCYLQDAAHPTNAVGYPQAAMEDMVRRSGLALAKPTFFGFWSGHHKGPFYGGQDAVILQKA